MVKKAVLVGINYKGTYNELNGCINDIMNINTYLIQKCKYSESNIKILTDDTRMKPTFLNIRNQINWLVSNNNPGDTLLFYYSGHGSYIRDNNKDESDRRDEVLVPIDYEKADMITDDWMFTNMVSKVIKGVTLWCFTDCCHSGTIIDLKYNYKSECKLKKGKKTTEYVPSEWSDKFSFSMENSNEVNGNVYMLSGCQDKETSADAFINNKSQGAFTFCLLELLKNKKTPMTLQNALKEINCRLDINGYGDQNSQLSLCCKEDFDRTFEF